MDNNNINNYKLSPVDNLILDFFMYNSSSNVKISELTWNDQTKFLQSTLQHSLFKKYPINKEFAKSFLKKIIHILEKDSEPHDDLYVCLCDLMKNEENDNQDACYNHYIIDQDIENIITILETKNMVVNGTTGLRTWEAGIILADWALSNKEIFSNKNILELGSGIGFTGIAITKYCNTKTLYLNDCHPEVLDTLCTNIEINFPDRAKDFKESAISYFTLNNNVIGVLNLDWNEFKDLPSFIIPDVVIGADIIYDPLILGPLVNVFNKLFLINYNLNIYIASIIRNLTTIEMFKNILDDNGICYEILRFDVPVHINWKSDVKKCLMRLYKKL